MLENTAGSSGSILDKVSTSELKTLRVAVRRFNLASSSHVGPILRNIEDPELVSQLVHARAENFKHPIFQRESVWSEGHNRFFLKNCNQLAQLASQSRSKSRESSSHRSITKSPDRTERDKDRRVIAERDRDKKSPDRPKSRSREGYERNIRDRSRSREKYEKGKDKRKDDLEDSGRSRSDTVNDPKHRSKERYDSGTIKRRDLRDRSSREGDRERLRSRSPHRSRDYRYSREKDGKPTESSERDMDRRRYSRSRSHSRERYKRPSSKKSPSPRYRDSRRRSRSIGRSVSSSARSENRSRRSRSSTNPTRPHYTDRSSEHVRKSRSPSRYGTSRRRSRSPHSPPRKYRRTSRSPGTSRKRSRSPRSPHPPIVTFSHRRSRSPTHDRYKRYRDSTPRRSRSRSPSQRSRTSSHKGEEYMEYPGSEYWLGGPMRPRFPMPGYYPEPFFPRMPGGPKMVPPRMPMPMMYPPPFRLWRPFFHRPRMAAHTIGAAEVSSRNEPANSTVTTTTDVTASNNTANSRSTEDGVTIVEAMESEKKDILEENKPNETLPQ